MIGEVSPRARSDRYGSKINRSHSPLRAYATPYATIMLASLLPQLVIAGAVPIVPPLGFLALVAWRLVRPGLLPIWAGFPLGAFDDLFSGQPFGCAIALWSAAMIGFEMLEARMPWRTFTQNWLIAAVVMAWYIVIAALFSGARIGGTMLIVLGPQIVLSLAAIPAMAWLVAGLDRFRLARVRSL